MGERSEVSTQTRQQPQSTPQVPAEILAALTAVGLGATAWGLIGAMVKTNAKDNGMTAEGYVRSHYAKNKKRWVHYGMIAKEGAVVTTGKLIDTKLGIEAEFSIIDRTVVDNNPNAIAIDIQLPAGTAKFGTSQVMFCNEVEVISGDESWQAFFVNEYIVQSPTVANGYAIVIWPLDLFQWLRDNGQENAWRAWCTKFGRRVN